jgi:HK97 gp10 family phage protein
MAGGTRIAGLKELRGRLEDLGDELLDACKAAIEESAEAVQEQTERTVPVDQGRLKQTVRIRYRDGKLTALVGWFDKDTYYATFVEHGTVSQSAQPSLHPALEAERSKLVDRVRAHVRRAVL